ncbi:MAG: helix-turn-helix transcriptional regulator [Lachnospiraceae bacterium]|nr:helix-turn-helix transcriptional regulator [Lachnospiraceae bacterium]
MDAKLLGQRIKEARLAKKMTQNEVVGSFITRNMLSQIESGSAVPSMKTLTYLAKVLDLPPAALLQDNFSDTTEQMSFENTEGTLPPSSAPLDPLTFFEAKKAYLAADDSGAYALLSSIPADSPLADEAAALSAKTALRLAASLYEAGNFEEALEMAKNAETAASKGIYASLELKSQALLLLSDTAAKLANADKNRSAGGHLSDEPQTSHEENS